MSDRFKDRSKLILIIVINILFILLMIFALTAFLLKYQQDFRMQNIGEIRNITQSTSDITTVVFDNQRKQIQDAVSYCRNKNATASQLLDYLWSGNSGDDVCYELIGSNYSGYAAVKDKNGQYVPVDYTALSYSAMQHIFDKPATELALAEADYTPEFSDSYTALKSVGVYVHMMLRDQNGSLTDYTLMLVSRSDTVKKRVTIKNSYTELSSVLIDANGDYILRDDGFKGENLYRYLYDYNNLTLDQSEALRAEVTQTGVGEFDMRNALGQNCIYVYRNVEGTEWYSVVCVPYSSFIKRTVDMTYAVMMIVIFILMCGFDFIWLAVLNRRLRNSVTNEKIANLAKTDFLSRMSHDMRTPMNGIIGMSRLIGESSDLEEIKTYNRGIRDSGEYLLLLINDTLDMNRIEAGKMTLYAEPVEQNTLITSIISEIMPIAKSKDIQIQCKANIKNGRYITVDRLRFKQIFMNLLSNAVKFTGEGGLIELIVENSETDSDTAHDIYTLRDNGIGMNAEFQKTMYNPFVQEHMHSTGLSRGSGLGLSIVKKLVDLMDAQITCTSAPGEGTEFVLDFRYKYSDGKPPRAEKESINTSHTLSGKRALVVEDNEINMIIMEKMLRNNGVEVERAVNGREAVDMFLNSRHNYYDVIFMDIKMPVMDGLEATRLIRAAERPDAKTMLIAAMTANAFTEDIEATGAAGMNAHFSKPIDPSDVFTTIAGMLDGNGKQ